jgi:hypothetical protein
LRWNGFLVESYGTQAKEWKTEEERDDNEHG